MPRQLRIDDISVNATGVVVNYTIGESPLPVEPAGTSFTFANRAEIGNEIRNLQDRLTPLDLLLLRLSYIAKSEPSLAHIKTLAEGKTITLDLIGATAVISQS